MKCYGADKKHPLLRLSFDGRIQVAAYNIGGYLEKAILPNPYSIA